MLGLRSGKPVAVMIAAALLCAPRIGAQDGADWQAAAGGRMAFEVASVKPSKGGPVSPGFPLNAGDAYRPTGGRFRADFPLWSYIQFAYKLWWPGDEQGREIERLPKWVTADRYAIEARAAGNPTKDQMRLMVQSLLAERFHLAAHFENREVPVFALTLVKAGKPGPNLRSHADGPPCGDFDSSANNPVSPRVLSGDAGAVQTFPPFCDSPAVVKKANGTRLLLGYRNATMEMLASSLSGLVGLGRPVVDRTGLSGRFDFTLEWAPDSPGPPPSEPAAPEPMGPTALEALRDQLGLKVEGMKAPVRILVVDRVARPSEN